MKTYFNQHNKWSLCDMAYKYVVRTADDLRLQGGPVTMERASAIVRGYLEA